MSEAPHPIVGTWTIVRAELDGQAMPSDAAAQVELHFSPTHYQVHFGSEPTDQGRYRIDASTPITQIELSGEAGVNAGKTIPGIFQLNGNRLRVCYAIESDDAPTDFSLPVGKRHYLATYRRKT